MLKFTGFVAAAAVALTLPTYTASAEAALGPSASVCEADGTAVLVNVTGLKSRTGRLRVNLYANNAATYLEKGKYLHRVDVAVPSNGAVAVCVPVSRPGSYAISIRHDRNGNGKTDMSDGGGFSGNPSVSVLDMALKRKPPLSRTAFSVGRSTASINVALKYAR